MGGNEGLHKERLLKHKMEKVHFFAVEKEQIILAAKSKVSHCLHAFDHGTF